MGTSAWPAFDLRVYAEGDLVLRAPEDDDLYDLLALARQGVHSPDIMPFSFPWTRLPSPLFDFSFLSYHWAARSTLCTPEWRLPLGAWSAGEPIGVVELISTNWTEERSVEIGIWLSMSKHSRGLGTLVAHAAGEVAFNVFEAERLLGWTVPENIAAREVAVRLGYREVGTDQTRGREQARWIATQRDVRAPGAVRIEHGSELAAFVAEVSRQYAEAAGAPE